REGEAQLAALAGAQVDPLEAAKGPSGRVGPGAAGDVELSDLVAVAGRRVRDRGADLGALRRPPRHETRVGEGRVAQSVSERVQRLALEVPVRAPLHRVIREGGQLLHALVERHREAAGRV